VVLLRFVTGTLISFSLVNCYDVDDSILHRVTFAAGPAKPSMADDVKKDSDGPDPYELHNRGSHVYLDNEGNQVPKRVVEEILSAQREQELGAGGDEVKINEIKIESANKKPVLKDLTEEQPLEDDEDLETVTMTTRHNEKYVCTIPRPREKQRLGGDGDGYAGQTPLDFLEPLLTQQPCTHRLDHYWTYELCHGKSLKQYHEERDGGNKVKKTEYSLGTYSKEQFYADKEALKLSEPKKPRKKRVESMNMPYYELVMTGGTLCDLSGLPRKTRVLYVCYPSGHHEVFSLEETSTCEYEVLVLSPLLCKHPDYRAESAQEKEIRCVPQKNNEVKPRDLETMEKENDDHRTKYASAYEGTFTTDSKGTVKISIKQVKPDDSVKPVGKGHVDIEDEPGTSPAVNLPPKKSKPRPERPPFKPLTDPVVVKEFLMGRHCLYGGAGWWKYEFCYGKKVDQYHEEDGKRVSVINLGMFDQDKHVEWVKANPAKAPKKPVEMRKQISHLYSDGDWCELANKKRRVEVKLKCKKSDSPSAVSLYLLEPKTCEYILGVESPLICDILPQADEHGLMADTIFQEGTDDDNLDQVHQVLSFQQNNPPESLMDDSEELGDEELSHLLEHAKRVKLAKAKSQSQHEKIHKEQLEQHQNMHGENNSPQTTVDTKLADEITDDEILAHAERVKLARMKHAEWVKKQANSQHGKMHEEQLKLHIKQHEQQVKQQQQTTTSSTDRRNEEASSTVFHSEESVKDNIKEGSDGEKSRSKDNNSGQSTPRQRGP